MQVIGLILLCAVVLIQTGCVTQSKCEKKYPTKDSTSVVFKDKIVRIHDTAWLQPVEMSFDTSSIGLPENIVFKHTEKNGHLTSTVSINKGKLSFKCKADSLQHVIDSLVTVTDTFLFKSEKSNPVIIKENKWWVKPLVYGFFILLFLVLLLLAWRYVSTQVKGLFGKL